MIKNEFCVIVLGIIFDPKTKKILIGRREKDPNIPELKWCFPGGKLSPGDEIDKTLKKKIKEKTGYTIKNLGTFFSKTYPEKENLLSVYFLTQIFNGNEKPGGDIVELKWIKPEELNKYFTTSLHKKLKEFLIELV
jgi:ADP-ribose pyrophosphatase YjhB (NUDIX family)